ncbi:MAG: radical SAM protein [Candidatus Omnitrophica bacterium]|nr:radical SAM protein [Candidatus Omnitrophota bacterium]
MSLGLDPISTHKKVCSFNCTYCQLGCAEQADAIAGRQVFVATSDLIEEIKLLESEVRIDYLTFSGNGEPTLAANLGEMITAVRSVRPEKVAVITNGTLLGRKDVQADLKGVDLVLVKLEAADERVFQALNRPAAGITWRSTLDGIKAFKGTFKGRFALQIMFVEANKAQASKLAALAREIGADEIQLNTPLRPNAEKPLSLLEMTAIKDQFAGLNVRMVYEEEKKDYHPFDDQQTIRRHGQYKQA